MNILSYLHPQGNELFDYRPATDIQTQAYLAYPRTLRCQDPEHALVLIEDLIEHALAEYGGPTQEEYDELERERANLEEERDAIEDEKGELAMAVRDAAAELADLAEAWPMENELRTALERLSSRLYKVHEDNR